MAVVTVKSAAITNRDATPAVLNQGRTNGGRVRHARGVMTVTSGDSVGSKYIACSIPSNAVPISVRISSPDIGTTTTADVGLYQTTANGSAAADVDLFGSAVSVSGGAISKSEVIFESGVLTIANSEKAVWELLALSADSQRDYDVALTLTGAADGTGTLIVEVDFVV